MKLSTARVAERMFSWMKSFLCHRPARVKLDNSLSHTIRLREGVPQGGLIFPRCLSVIFINDVSTNLSQHISAAVHADDFVMWSASKSSATPDVIMQEDLDNPSKWASNWSWYHGGQRPSSDDSFHSPTVISPSALDKPSIAKRYHRRQTTR